jgi:hypothetical protein
LEPGPKARLSGRPSATFFAFLLDFDDPKLRLAGFPLCPVTLHQGDDSYD